MDKEQADVTAVQKKIDLQLKALEVLSDKVDALADNDPKRAICIEQANRLNKAIYTLEEQKKIEVVEAAQAVEFLNAIKEMFEGAKNKYERAARKRDQVVHDLKMVNIVQQKASDKLDQVRQLEDLRRSGGGLTDDVEGCISTVAAKTRLKAEADNLAAESIIDASSGSVGGDLAEQILEENNAFFAENKPDPVRKSAQGALVD